MYTKCQKIRWEDGLKKGVKFFSLTLTVFSLTLDLTF